MKTPVSLLRFILHELLNSHTWVPVDETKAHGIVEYCVGCKAIYVSQKEGVTLEKTERGVVFTAPSGVKIELGVY